MVRRRTATLSLTAVAVLLATPLISSCSAEHPGSAAVIGGQSVSVADLQAQVKQVRAAQNSTGQSEQLIDATSDLDRSTLNSIVFDKVLARAASDAGVRVGRSQVQQLEAAAVQQTGSMAALRTALLEQYAVAPGQLDTFYFAQARAQAIAHALGVDLTTQSGQAAVTATMTKASRELHVDVNPRYGTWNAKTLTLGTAATPWLRETSSPASAQTPVQG
jgi:SurA N-terminal domain